MLNGAKNLVDMKKIEIGIEIETETETEIETGKRSLENMKEIRRTKKREEGAFFCLNIKN